MFPPTTHLLSRPPTSLLIITLRPSQPSSDTLYHHMHTSVAIPSLMTSPKLLSPTNGKPLHQNATPVTRISTSMSRHTSPMLACTQMKMLLCVRLSPPPSKDQSWNGSPSYLHTSSTVSTLYHTSSLHSLSKTAHIKPPFIPPQRQARKDETLKPL